MIWARARPGPCPWPQRPRSLWCCPEVDLVVLRRFSQAVTQGHRPHAAAELAERGGVIATQSSACRAPRAALLRARARPPGAALGPDAAPRAPRADDDPVAQAFVLRKSSLNEEQFNKFLHHRLGPGAFGFYSGASSADGSYSAGGHGRGGASFTNGGISNYHHAKSAPHPTLSLTHTPHTAAAARASLTAA